MRRTLRAQHGPPHHQGRDDQRRTQEGHPYNSRPEADIPRVIPSLPGACGRIVASSAGTNTRLANNVHPRLSNSNRPMLAVPGCPESASEPNAVPVVSAENTTARAVADRNGARCPAR